MYVLIPRVSSNSVSKILKKKLNPYNIRITDLKYNRLKNSELKKKNYIYFSFFCDGWVGKGRYKKNPVNKKNHRKN